jgi:nucleoside-diphosphate-sugar epimerase
VTDGTPIVFRDLVVRLLATEGLEAPARTLPFGVAAAVTIVGERAWRTLRLPGRPPSTRMAFWLSALECTIDTSRARDELGYVPVVDREDGLAALSAS